jgi:hypothetical protein
MVPADAPANQQFEYPMKRALLVASVFLLHPAFAAIPDHLAVKAIVGEGANQSDAALLAIASAIRNRGTLHGVYGLNSPVTRTASRNLWTRAERAWWQAKSGVDTAAGCKFFGNPADAPYFTHTLHFKPVKTIGQITFYKP